MTIINLIRKTVLLQCCWLIEIGEEVRLSLINFIAYLCCRSTCDILCDEMVTLGVVREDILYDVHELIRFVSFYSFVS